MTRTTPILTICRLIPNDLRTRAPWWDRRLSRQAFQSSGSTVTTKANRACSIQFVRCEFTQPPTSRIRIDRPSLLTSRFSRWINPRSRLRMIDHALSKLSILLANPGTRSSGLSLLRPTTQPILQISMRERPYKLETTTTSSWWSEIRSWNMHCNSRQWYLRNSDRSWQ